MERTEYLLEVRDLVKEFKIKREFGSKGKEQSGHVIAVNHASLKIRKGEIYGLVGESGCGKSTFGTVRAATCCSDGGKHPV